MVVAWTAPRTWVAGETVTAAMLNAQVRDNLKAITDPWTAYTPTIGGWTLGASTLTGRYMQVGKTVDVSVRLVLGAGMSMATTPSFSLPVAVKTGWTVSGVARFDDLGTNAYMGLVDASGSTAYVWSIGTSGARNHVTLFSPITWMAGDIVTFDLKYETN